MGNKKSAPEEGGGFEVSTRMVSSNSSMNELAETNPDIFSSSRLGHVKASPPVWNNP